MAYYDGTKLLSMMDINGNKPEIYICTSNRSAGKTTYFSRWLINKFLKSGEKFGLLYRFNYELDGVADKFFKDLQNLFFPRYSMTSKKRSKGIYHELYLQHQENEPVCCGYAISINSADQIKKYSHLFSDITRMLMDEFQSESNHYCNNEVTKFISVHTTIARGAGKQYRYVPVIMLSNTVSIINPYYVELNISSRLRENTKFLRGDGYVLEQGFNESASLAQKGGAFLRAFSKNKYMAYSTQTIYLNDSTAFIDKPYGYSRYLGTLKYLGVMYALREYVDMGIIYCDKRPDCSHKYKICVTTNDHNINYIMLKRNDMFIQNMRFFFEHGCFRFYDISCKEAVLKMISY